MSSPSSSVLQQFHHLNRSSPNFPDKLCHVIYGSEYSQCVSNLQGDELVWLVDYLDKVRCRITFPHPPPQSVQALDGLEPSGPAFRKCLRELRSRCGDWGILPASYTLAPHLLNVGSEPFASGACGDVFEGTLDGSRICIKRIRVYTQYGPQKAAKVRC